MLGKPSCGWVTVSYDNEIIGSASYLTDVDVDLLSTCVKYLRGDIDRFYVDFNAEGYLFGFTQINNEIYIYTEEDADAYGAPRLKWISSNYIDPLYLVEDIAQEVSNDIEKNFDDWCDWTAFTDEDKRAKKEELLTLLTDLQVIFDSPRKSGIKELGNELFGHSTGEYQLRRDKWEDVFHDFLNDCKFDSYGYIDDDKLEKKYGHRKESKYSNRDIYGDNCKNETIKNNLDYHSHIHYFDNDVFMVNPYYWGDSADLADIPNFIYYPENIEIKWYKYPLRDAWINKQITFEEFYNILNKCKESLKSERNTD